MAILALSCQQSEPIVLSAWEVLLKDLGTSSSARAIDLNADGIKDIVTGAGRAEFTSSDSAIIALDGRTGALLWTVQARDQIFGSPLFLQITDDTIPEIIIGGRSAELLAINGATGKIVWEFFPEGDSTDNTQFQLYNFYNAQNCKDIDRDGTDDILIANGGYVKAKPNEVNRPAGKLMLISGQTGRLIQEAYMPDHQETYMSCTLLKKQGETFILYGSGGETQPGKLFLSKIEDLQQGNLSKAYVLAESLSKGFIAPPVLVDITGDGTADIIANAVDGRTLAIDGQTLRTIWTFTVPNTEVYCSLAVGHFNADSIPDVFTNYGIGQFPNLMRSMQVALSGNDGSLLFSDSLGSFHYDSPVAYDLDQDGFDEVIFQVNQSIPGVVKNVLKVFDFNDSTIYNFSKESNGGNLGSTPLLEDLNQDGRMEIVMMHENNPFDLFSIERKTGFWIKMITTDIIIKQPIKWGSYMGSRYDGTY